MAQYYHEKVVFWLLCNKSWP